MLSNKEVPSRENSQRRSGVFALFYTAITGGGLENQPNRDLLAYVSTPQGKQQLTVDRELQRAVQKQLTEPMARVRSVVGQSLVRLGMSERTDGYEIVLKNATTEIFEYMIAYFGVVRLDGGTFPHDFVTMMYMVAYGIERDYAYYASFVEKALQRALSQGSNRGSDQSPTLGAVDTIMAAATEAIVEACTDLSEHEFRLLSDARFVGHRGPETLPALQIKKIAVSTGSGRNIVYCQLWQAVLSGLKGIRPDRTIRKVFEQKLLQSVHTYLEQVTAVTVVPQVIWARETSQDDRKELGAQQLEVSTPQQAQSFGASLVALIAAQTREITEPQLVADEPVAVASSEVVPHPLEASPVVAENVQEAVLKVHEELAAAPNVSLLEYCQLEGFDLTGPLVQEMIGSIRASWQRPQSEQEVAHAVVMHTIFTVCSLCKDSLFRKFSSFTRELLEDAFVEVVLKLADIKLVLNANSNIKPETREAMEQMNWIELVAALNAGKLSNKLYGYIRTIFRNTAIDLSRRSRHHLEQEFSDFITPQQAGGDELVTVTFDEKTPPLEVQVLHAELLSRIHAFIAKLKPRQQSLIFGKADGLSYAEMSDLLQIKEGTVKSGLSRALVALYSMIEHRDPTLQADLCADFPEYTSIGYSSEYRTRFRK
jgi:RNA polymerase sigma factor (sigma-70 family)